MFGKEKTGGGRDLHHEGHLLVPEDKISIRGARLLVVLHHIQRELKSQGDRRHWNNGMGIDIVTRKGTGREAAEPH